MSKKVVNKPTNTVLYEKVKTQAKKKFNVWPSAYASGWLVQEYKRLGGTYSGKKQEDSGLNRWFNEKWINVCKLPKIVTCGRSSGSLIDWMKKYPYCRPSKKITKSTPLIASKLSKKEIQTRCSIKQKSPLKRVILID
jgi:hypothetical protein